MANVIDALTVTLGLDASQFKSGQQELRGDLRKSKDEAARVAAEMQARGKQAAEFFSQVKNEALGLIGVLLGSRSIEQFTRDATNSMAQLGRDSKNIGVAARELGAFQMMIERNGGSAEAATNSLKGYADAIERFKQFGDASIVQYLNPIGAKVEDNPLDVYEKFVRFVEQNKNRPGGIQLINLEGRGLGYDQALINATIQIGSLARAQQELAKSYEIGVPTQEQIDRVTAMQNAFIGLGQAGSQAGKNLVADVAPVLTQIATAMTTLIEKQPGTAATLAVIAGYLTTIAALNFGSVIAFLGRLFPLIEFLQIMHPTALNENEQKELDRLRREMGLPTGVQGTPTDRPPTGRTPDERRQAAADWWAVHAPTWLGGTPSLGPALAPDIEAEVRRQASIAGLDQEHMVRLARKEGGGYNRVSSAGAFGPMQLMPGTAAQYGVTPASRWQDNVHAGTAYYADLLKAANGNYALADAAYNAGPNNAGVKWFMQTGDPSRLPAETQNYVKSINGASNGVPQVGPTFGPQQQGGVNLPSWYLHGGAAAGAYLRVPPSTAPAGGDTSVSVGDVTVHTQATDAHGIARDINQQITDSWLAMANRGLN